MRFMCLDQSGITGFCHGVAGSSPGPQAPGSNHGPPVWGVRKLTTSASISSRLCSLEDWVREMIRANGLEKVYCEDPIAALGQGSFESRMALMGYCNAIGMACHREGIQSVRIPSATWRSEFKVPTQAPKKIKGSAERRKWVKGETIARCQKLGFTVTDDNAADAIGMWWAMSERLVAKERSPTLDLFAGSHL